MPQTKPYECPACGYERIQRTPAHLHPSDRSDGVERWTCRLCAYEWRVNLPHAPSRDEWVTV